MENPGVAFGLWSGVPLYVTGAALVVLIVLLLKTRSVSARIGLSLMLAGGLGNGWQRAQYQAVFDPWILGFLRNNIWDYLITFGLGLYFWAWYRERAWRDV
jgi:lipoprotein signal peptidase